MNVRNKSLARGAIIGAVLVLAGLAAVLLTRPRPAVTEISGNAALVGGPFALIDQTGRTRTEKAFRGQYLLIYFGYTFCPDVCPSELKAMSDGLARFEASDPKLAGKIQPLFVTVDPARDTPAVLKEYTANFHPRLAGLTGTEEAVSNMLKEWRVYAKRSGDGPDYMMDHSSMIYLMGPDGGFITVFSNGTAPDAIAKGLASHVF